MANLKEHTRIAHLLAALITDTVTEAEREEINLWKNTSAKNTRLFQEITEASFLPEQSKRIIAADTLKAYQAVLEKRKKNERRRLIQRIILIAAVFLLPITVSVLLIQNADKNTMIPPVIAEQQIKPGEAKAELLLSDGSRMLLNVGLKDSSLIQQGTQVKAGDKEIAYQKNQEAAKLAYNTLKVPRGGEFKVVLSDGTVVYLNSESELKYPVQFGRGQRLVSLTGEAYFEVKKEANRPFIVNLSSSSVEVLGTSFNVRAYKDEQKTATTLVEGKVLFHAFGKSLSLEPGEQAIAGKSGKFSKQKVDVYQYTAWRNGNFVFRQQRLETVMQELSRWYDIDIFFANPSRKEMSFSGNVKRYGDFGKIIEMLEMTGGAEFQVTGRTVVVK